MQRQRDRRAPYDKVLIVCEGEKTEPNYLNELLDYYKLNTANIKISGDCGSAPINIVEHAKQCYRDEKRSGIRFDRVYCVFDKDTHRSYQPALDIIASAVPKETFYAITSVPCFEFWLLRHFVCTTQPFCGTPSSKSAGDRVIDDLLKYLPAYTKSDEGIFTQLIDQLPQAIRNSETVLRASKQDGTDNPSIIDA